MHDQHPTLRPPPHPVNQVRHTEMLEIENPVLLSLPAGLLPLLYARTSNGQFLDMELERYVRMDKYVSLKSQNPPATLEESRQKFDQVTKLLNTHLKSQIKEPSRFF